MCLEVDSNARAACRRFARENNPLKDKLRAARRLDPDRAGELPAHLRLGLRDGWLLFKILNPPSGF